MIVVKPPIYLGGFIYASQNSINLEYKLKEQTEIVQTCTMSINNK